MLDFEFSGRVVCMGGINMDLVMFMDRLPLPGETLVTDNFAEIPGGKGGNQAFAAARLNADTHFFGKVGGDTYGDRLLAEMRRVGVNTDNISRDPEVGAGIAMVFVDASGQNAICFTPGANRRLTPAEVRANAQVFNPGDIMLATMEPGTDTIYTAVEVAKERGAFVILDPAPVEAAIPAHIPPLVDIVKPNEMEAGLITGVEVTGPETAVAAIEALLAMGFRMPIVTLGDQGSVIHMDGRAVRVPPVAVRTVDATAAGDVFNGGLASALSMNRGIEYALRFASMASAISTTVKGAQPSVPDYETVVRALGQ